MFYWSWALVILASCQSPSAKQDRVVKSPQELETPENKKVILFFGNSITAGYQLDLSEAFPALIQEKLDSLKMDYRTVNAGLSGETTASGLSRLDWVLKNAVDIFVLELGANDGLRGLKLDQTTENLQNIIDQVKAKYPSCKIVLAGMMIPPNMGVEYGDSFRNIYPTLAEKNNLSLIPFLLDGVAGNPDLNLEDGIHPTPEGHQILSETVWKVLEPIL